jgi:mono/diheme cytochrome c family protein
MPAYPVDELPDAQLDAVVEYLLRLRGDVVVDSALADGGAALWFDLDCSGCHANTPALDGDGAPGFIGRGRPEWVARVIADSSGPDLFDDIATMPKFSDKLSRDEIWALAEFIASRGELERLEHPPAIPRVAVLPEPVTTTPEPEPEESVGETVATDAEPEPEPDETSPPKPTKKTKKKAKPNYDLGHGKSVFLKKCKSCHGADGKGETSYGKKIGVASLVGSKLSRAKVEKVVRKGVAGTKMKAYEAKLSADELRDVVAYVSRL